MIAVSLRNNLLAHGKTCDMNDKENHTIYCHTKLNYHKLPGQKFVYTPKECFNGNANNLGYCRGLERGASCSNNGDADCDVDLYCDPIRKSCQPAARSGEHCDDTTKCASYLLCAWEDGTHFLCRNYGLYPNGKSLGAGDEDDICQSNYIDNDFTCDDGPILLGTNLKDIEGAQCKYSRGDEEEATCWYHADGHAICKKGAKDLIPEWKKALAYLRLQPQCHVSIPMAQCDMGREVMGSQKEWEDTWFAISRLHWEVQLEGLAPCMRQYVHPETFKYIGNYSGSVVPLSILALISLLFLIF